MRRFLEVLFLMTTSAIFPKPAIAEDYPLEISAGFYAVPSPKLPPNYDRITTLLYKIPRPEFDESKMSIIDHRCDSSKQHNYTCLVFFEYQKIGSEMKSEIMARSSIVFTSKSVPPKSKIISTQSDCHLVGRHFESLESSFKFEEYTKWLETCWIPSEGRSNKTYSLTTLEPHFNPDDLKASYQKIVSRFVDEFNSSLSKPADYYDDDTVHGPAAHLQVLLTAQSQLLSHYQFEAQRWEDAIQACMSQRLPLGLLNLTILTSNLSSIDHDLEDGYELTFSPAQISMYASNPLTDCTFVKEDQNNQNSFVVRLQVPIRRKTFMPQLVQVFPLPFLYRSDAFSDREISEVPQVFSGYGSGFSSNSPNFYLADLNPHVYVPTDCQPKNSPCYIDSETFQDSSAVSCVSAALNRNLEVLYHKPQQCIWKKQSRYQSPIIIETNKPGLFHVVATRKDVLMTRCHSEEPEVLNFGAPIGAFQVQLGCGCELQYKGKFYRSHLHHPCPTSKLSKTIVKHLVPLNFFSRDVAEKFQLGLHYNLTFKDLAAEHMNPMFRFFETNSSSNANAFKAVCKGDETSPPNATSADSTGLSILGLWIVIGVLSVFVALLIVIVYNNGGYSFQKIRTSQNGFSRFELRSQRSDTEMTNPVLDT